MSFLIKILSFTLIYRFFRIFETGTEDNVSASSSLIANVHNELHAFIREKAD